MECQYIFKKGPKKGQQCKVVNCIKHPIKNSVQSQTPKSQQPQQPQTTPQKIVTVSVTIPQTEDNSKI
jgi:hypothetical protein